MEIKEEIKKIITSEVKKLNRPDLFREPVIGFSKESNPKFKELKEIIGPWHLLPRDILCNCNTVITYYVPFTKEVALSPIKYDYSSPIWSESYTVINEGFEKINNRVIEYIKSIGYDASLLVTKMGYNSETLIYEWSNKSALVIAGLGDFTRNRTVITNKGLAVRISSIFTSLDIGEDNIYTGQKCDNCLECVKICPVNALDDDLDFKKFDCQTELNKNGEILKITGIDTDTCGKCQGICKYAYLE